MSIAGPPDMNPYENGWVYDVVCGVYKNEKLSKMIRRVGFEQCSLLNLVKVSNITSPRTFRVTCSEPFDLKPLQKRAPIAEEDLIRTVPCKEWGMAIPYTSLAEDFPLDINAVCNQALVKIARQVYETIVATELRTTYIRRVVKWKGCKPVQDVFLAKDINFWLPRFDGWLGRKLGRFNQKPVLATRSIYPEDLELALDHMKTVNPHRGRFYFVCGYETMIYFKHHKEWEPWDSYVIGDSRLPGEEGRWRGVIFLYADLKRTYKGSGEEAFLVAGNPLHLFIAQELEARAGIPRDFGRSKSVAMYGLMGCGLEDRYNAVFHFCGAPHPTPLPVLVYRTIRSWYYRASWKVRLFFSRLWKTPEPELEEEYDD